MALFDPVRTGLSAIAAGIVGWAAFALQAPIEPAALAGGMAALAAWFALPRPAPPAPPAPEPEPAGPDLDQLLAAVDDPLLIVSRQIVTHANPAALTTLGRHIVGEDVRVAIRHPAAAERLSARATANGSSEQPAIELVGLGERDRRWELVVHDYAPGQRLVRLADRTGAYAAERMRVDFVANASHELRTPLSTLIGFIETLEDGKAVEDSATRSRFLKIMAGEAKRMQQLVSDLMSLSRIEAEKYSAPQMTLDLAALASEVRDAHHADRPRIAIEAPADLPPVAGDRAQLSQLLHNLIGNAIKYGRAGAPIKVSIGRTDGMMRLAVADEGDGIPPEHLPRLTERFYRVDPGRSRALGGTGLGLAIVKHIVERHRGRLDIDSIVGRGTTVSVLLPAAPEALSSKSHETVTQDAPNRPSGLFDPA